MEHKAPAALLSFTVAISALTGGVVPYLSFTYDGNPIKNHGPILGIDAKDNWFYCDVPNQWMAIMQETVGVTGILLAGCAGVLALGLLTSGDKREGTPVVQQLYRVPRKCLLVALLTRVVARLALLLNWKSTCNPQHSEFISAMLVVLSEVLQVATIFIFTNQVKPDVLQDSTAIMSAIALSSSLFVSTLALVIKVHPLSHISVVIAGTLLLISLSTILGSLILQWHRDECVVSSRTNTIFAAVLVYCAGFRLVAENACAGTPVVSEVSAIVSSGLFIWGFLTSMFADRKTEATGGDETQYSLDHLWVSYCLLLMSVIVNSAGIIPYAITPGRWEEYLMLVGHGLIIVCGGGHFGRWLWGNNLELDQTITQMLSSGMLAGTVLAFISEDVLSSDSEHVFTRGGIVTVDVASAFYAFFMTLAAALRVITVAVISLSVLPDTATSQFTHTRTMQKIFTFSAVVCPTIASVLKCFCADSVGTSKSEAAFSIIVSISACMLMGMDLFGKTPDEEDTPLQLDHDDGASKIVATLKSKLSKIIITVFLIGFLGYTISAAWYVTLISAVIDNAYVSGAEILATYTSSAAVFLASVSLTLLCPHCYLDDLPWECFTSPSENCNESDGSDMEV
eukprot:TRINITY_DN168_c3_g2_i1.p1 TRINITY_DN168_c3_g2~~TRINITY_DN168_c3_g2_i1.p1  ORF type:complete len:624 (+),score=42.82 TRINITY_DN168_c3_g2_i1:44-1915(+)